MLSSSVIQVSVYRGSELHSNQASPDFDLWNKEALLAFQTLNFPSEEK